MAILLYAQLDQPTFISQGKLGDFLAKPKTNSLPKKYFTNAEDRVLASFWQFVYAQLS